MPQKNLSASSSSNGDLLSDAPAVWRVTLPESRLPASAEKIRVPIIPPSYLFQRFLKQYKSRGCHRKNTNKNQATANKRNTLTTALDGKGPRITYALVYFPSQRRISEASQPTAEHASPPHAGGAAASQRSSQVTAPRREALPPSLPLPLCQSHLTPNPKHEHVGGQRARSCPRVQPAPRPPQGGGDSRVPPPRWPGRAAALRGSRPSPCCPALSCRHRSPPAFWHRRTQPRPRATPRF